MRVAAISDIHGNLPALEAVLADIEREGVDAIVVAGDTRQRAMAGRGLRPPRGASDALVVRGNADRLEVIERADEHGSGLERGAQRLGDGAARDVAAHGR